MDKNYETDDGQMKTEIKDGMRIDWDTPIKMKDGIVLRADIYRPIEEGKYPVILTYGAYGKGLSWIDNPNYSRQYDSLIKGHPDVSEGTTLKYQNWETVDPEKWVPDNYICIRVDARGAGRSPGHLDPKGPQEAQDIYECIEWAGIQPWSNGKVGMLGISYYATNQWHVAALNPPHLAAIIPWEGYNDQYREGTHHGGIYCGFTEGWFEHQIKPIQHGIGKRGAINKNNGRLVSGPVTLSEEELAERRTKDMRQELLSHPLFDDYHKKRATDLSKIKVPLLSSANWAGLGRHARGNFEGYMRAGSEQKWLEVHGLEHWTLFYTEYGIKLQKRFFDHFLKGMNNDWKEQPPVLLQIRTVDGEFIERHEQEWPLSRTEWTKFYLDASNKELCSEPIERKGAVEYNAFEDGLEAGVTFMSDPFEVQTEITGPIASKLFISSSTSDADLFLTLRLFDPEGEEVLFTGYIDPRTPLSQGWLRASHRKLDPELSKEFRPFHAHDEIQPLEPNEIYELDIEIWPTSIIVPKGYRIGLTIRGTDYENIDEGPQFSGSGMRGSGPFYHNDPEDRPKDVYGGQTTIHSSKDHHSYLLLPIIN